MSYNTGQYQTVIGTGTQSPINGIGIIYYSTNYGVNWNVSTSPPSTNTTLTNPTKLTCVAINSDGTVQSVSINNGTSVYYSYDFGNTWTSTIKTYQTFSSVASSSSGQTQIAVATNGNIFNSTNYGVTFNLNSSTSLSNWTSVATSSSGKYASACMNGTGVNGSIFTSTNYGNTWSINNSAPTNCSWTSIAMSSSGQYQTAVNNTSSTSVYIGTMFTSTDYGNTWVQNSSVPSSNWSSVAMSSSGQYQTAVMNNLGSGTYNGFIFTSTDYGNTWIPNNSAPSSNWTSVSMSSSGQYQMACMNLGQGIFVSMNYGNTWINNTSAPSPTPYSSIAISSSGQYAISLVNGGAGSIYTCYNASAYWTPTGGTGSTGGIYYSGNLYVNGMCQATSFNATSDYRIKQNPLLLNENFVVDELKPVIYRNIITNQIDIGLIAHELQDIYSFLVNGEKDGIEMQSINYIGIIGILIKEIQKLKNDVKLLKDHL
jgi:hypothetical protein